MAPWVVRCMPIPPPTGPATSRSLHSEEARPGGCVLAAGPGSAAIATSHIVLVPCHVHTTTEKNTKKTAALRPL